ncbi:VC_2705 family sodium/solute symporter [Aliarcobacter butzleri]|uniref:VC_2705 family sodium/solute symporter n=1 Tax=Aliarcobacter butzleri TaxID=28197 RepID=UPI003AFAA209
MELQSLIYLFGTITFAIYVGLALWTKASSTKDFYIANNKVNPIFIGVSIATEWIGAASFISIAGTISYLGYNGTPYILGFTGGFVLLTLLVVPYLKKFGKFTIPDFIAQRYYSNKARLLTIIIIILASFIYISAQMKGLGIIFSRFFQVDMYVGLLSAIGILFLYAIFTGMRTNNYTQIAQYIIILFAYTFCAIFLSLQLTNNFLPQLAIFSTTTFDFITPIQTIKEGTSFLIALDKILLDFGFNSYSKSLDLVNVFMITMALMLGTAALPHLLIKFFALTTVKDTKKSALWALIFVALIFTTISSVASFSKINLLKNVQNIEYESFTQGELINYDGSKNNGKWLQIWQNTGFISWKDKNEDKKIQINGTANNELFINPDIITLVNAEIANLPNWIIALLISGALAAILATTTGLLLIIVTTISYDLWDEFIYKNNKKHVLKNRIKKLTIILIVFIIVVLATFFTIPFYSIVQTVTISFTLIAATIFPAIILGIFDKRMNKEGAFFGILTGFIFTFCYIVYFLFFNNSIENMNNYLFGITPEGIGTVGAILNFAIALIISRLTPLPPKSVQRLIQKIRIPTNIKNKMEL